MGSHSTSPGTPTVTTGPVFRAGSARAECKIAWVACRWTNGEHYGAISLMLPFLYQSPSLPTLSLRK